MSDRMAVVSGRRWAVIGLDEPVFVVEQVRIFSRKCEDRTASYPDVGNALRNAAAGVGCHPASSPV